MDGAQKHDHARRRICGGGIDPSSNSRPPSYHLPRLSYEPHQGTPETCQGLPVGPPDGANSGGPRRRSRSGLPSRESRLLGCGELRWDPRRARGPVMVWSKNQIGARGKRQQALAGSREACLVELRRLARGHGDAGAPGAMVLIVWGSMHAPWNSGKPVEVC
jgi:hypothetical protein